eukprot:7949-Heterococcus_DN1.PRE.8
MQHYMNALHAVVLCQQAVCGVGNTQRAWSGANVTCDIHDGLVQAVSSRGCYDVPHGPAVRAIHGVSLT